MVTSQQSLDAALDRERTFAVEIAADAPFPQGTGSYDAVAELVQTGFTITARELLHAIGSKTAALPSSMTDECLRSSLLYTYLLDLESPHIRFARPLDSDLQTPRSQEIGIGMMCLLASKMFGVPWDQLGSLPGPGLRFDYRGQRAGFDGIFESKGTSHRRNQNSQIRTGVDKKQAHHGRGEQFDVELIISTYIGRGNAAPRILLGDPDFDEMAKLYQSADDRFFRLRHYARVLQFVGLPKSAFHLNIYARSYLKGERSIDQTILSEKENVGFLATETLGNQRYLGRWFDSVAPEGSRRYPKDRYGEKLTGSSAGFRKRRVFQGMHEDVYRAGFSREPFSHDLLSSDDIARTLSRADRRASLFPDGTVQFFEQN